MERLNGSAIARRIREEIKEYIIKTGIRPGLSVILVGNNPSSHLYVNLKEKAARETGILFNKYIYDENTPEADIVTQIRILNYDNAVHGILVQLPLPKHLDQYKIIGTIDPQKDVDGFHPANVHAFARGENPTTPVLVKAIKSLISETKRNISGKHAVILANSNILANPTKTELERMGATVSAYSPTPQTIPEETRTADIIISALGRPHIINEKHIQPGAILIDVGITKSPKGKLLGDIDYHRCKDVASYITPVPGGVGPVTVAQLLANTLELAEQQIYENNSPIGF